MKHAVVTPALKKTSLDATDVNNYRPISNLSFLSKLLERCAHTQIMNYLNENNLLPGKQSAYRKYHSTETALLDLLSDANIAADDGKVTLLGMLDQSSAFDTIDHKILLQRMRSSCGFSGMVLEWLKSYITDRTQVVHFNGEVSTVAVLCSGIPQGSVLGPLIFIIYSADVIRIIQECGFKAHAYADDLQIYAQTDPMHTTQLMSRFSSCMDKVNDWMASNRLCLNPSKT